MIALGTLPVEWIVITWLHTQTTSFHSKRFSLLAKTHRVSRDGRRGSDTRERLEKYEGPAHIQGSGIEVVKHEATC